MSVKTVAELLEERNVKIRKEFSQLKKKKNTRDSISDLAIKYKLSNSMVNFIVYPRNCRKKGKNN